MFSQWVTGNLRFQHEVLEKDLFFRVSPVPGGLAVGKKGTRSDFSKVAINL